MLPFEQDIQDTQRRMQERVARSTAVWRVMEARRVAAAFAVDGLAPQGNVCDMAPAAGSVSPPDEAVHAGDEAA